MALFPTSDGLPREAPVEIGERAARRALDRQPHERAIEQAAPAGPGLVSHDDPVPEPAAIVLEVAFVTGAGQPALDARVLDDAAKPDSAPKTKK